MRERTHPTVSPAVRAERDGYSEHAVGGAFRKVDGDVCQGRALGCNVPYNQWEVIWIHDWRTGYRTGSLRDSQTVDLCCDSRTFAQVGQVNGSNLR